MKQKFTLLLFLFFSLAYSQTSGFDVQEKERIIKKLVASNPDSARVYINQILHYKGKLPDTVYANANLFYGYTHLLKNKPDSALYYYNKAITYTGNSVAHHARALRNKAAAYRKKADFDNSMDVLAIAEQKYLDINDNKGLATVYGEMASNYNMMLQSDDAIRYLLKAIKLLEREKDNFYIYTIKQSLANTYMNAGNFEFAIDLYNEVLPQFKTLKTKNYYLTLINYGDCFMYLKRYDEARKAFLEGKEGLEHFNDKELVAVAQSKLGRIESVHGDIDKAPAYYEPAYRQLLAMNSPRLLQVAADYVFALNRLKRFDDAVKVITLTENSPAKEKGNLADKLAFEGQKTYTYKKVNDTGKVLAALENKLELMDTLSKTNDEAATMQIQQEYQSNYLDKKNKALTSINTSLEGKVSESRNKYLIPIVILSLVFISLFGAYLYKSKANRKKLFEAQKSYDSELTEYERAKETNLQHKKDIEARQGELVSNIMMLNSIEGNISYLMRKVHENPDGVDIENIKNQLESLTAEKDYWALFRKRFNEADKEFQNGLARQYPQLTKKDLFFCSLLKLKLPYKDIAMLMQVSPESIVKKKYRVKQRMEIQSEHELENALQEAVA